MNAVQWSPHAESLLEDIVLGIAEKLYPDDGLRWEAKLRETADELGRFPLSGDGVPLECFDTIPPNADDLRQTFCRPYRIVYEVVGNEVHILSIRHSRMLVTTTDTFWN